MSYVQYLESCLYEVPGTALQAAPPTNQKMAHGAACSELRNKSLVSEIGRLENYSQHSPINQLCSKYGALSTVISVISLLSYVCLTSIRRLAQVLFPTVPVLYLVRTGTSTATHCWICHHHFWPFTSDGAFANWYHPRPVQTGLFIRYTLHHFSLRSCSF